MIKESLGRHDETGSAETALRASVQDPRLLQRMQMSGGTYAFQGGDPRTVGNALHFHGAGTHKLAVDNDVAGPALAGAASDLHAGAAQFAQHVGEGFVAFHHQAARDAIHNQLFFKHMTLLGGLARR